jgi:glycine betaine catabolism B
MMRLTCRGVRTETPSIKTFVLEPADAMLHEAGQALTLSFMVDGERVARTFSISSAPATGGPVELTIKAHPAGRATQWLHANLREGSVLEARPPSGRFTLAKRRPGASLALLSAGSGATPLMSMLRDLSRTDPGADVAWFHVARHASEILFPDELARLQAIMPNLSVAVTLTAPAAGWFGYRGRATRRLLSVAVPDLGRRDVFCCGPHGFMDEIKLIYAAEGGTLATYHTEAFHPKPAAAGEPSAQPMDGRQFRLQIGGRVLGLGSGETVLQAALRQGVIIPCGCGQGMCGTCRVKMISGEVELCHQGGISEEEEAEGFILACSSRAKSDLVIGP